MKESRRIEFDQEVLDFIKDYRAATGVSLQQFVEMLVVEKVRELKLEAELNDLKLSGK